MFELRSSSLPTSCAILFSCATLLGCGSKQSPPAESPATEAPAEPTADATAAPAERPKLTADECTASGGSVVGDIGDGAIHRPDYRCPSGAEPSGSIQSAADEPVAVEGSVCCPG
jgi:hypothetical protein